MFDYSSYVKIRILVNVNGYKRGDVLVVNPDDRVFSGWIKNRMAEVI